MHPNLNRHGTPAKRSKRRERTKTCPSCGRTFHTRSKFQQHLRGSLERAHATALEHDLDDTAAEIAETLNKFPDRKE